MWTTLPNGSFWDKKPGLFIKAQEKWGSVLNSSCLLLTKIIQGLLRVLQEEKLVLI